ncbi:MAG: class I SAM-dependent methyltransferase [Proteobacteria bacterium]|nr:class I SAM-dependent methyltransferase [Pseudomonadota bacterium]
MRPSLIAGGFFTLTQLVPKWRTPLWQFWYDTLARRDTGNSLLFMNYGYDDGAPGPALEPPDEPFRYAIQLYAATLRGIEMRGADVLEVGSGRGGGGSYIIRYYAPNSYTGIDLSKAAIDRCQRDLSHPRTRWIQGRADVLPIDSNSVSIVLNVESSHSYPSMSGFLREVLRVLRPGGHFAFADVRKADLMPQLASQLADSGMNTIAQGIITPHVLRALDGISSLREQQIVANVPPLFRPAFRDFAGVKKSVLHTMLRDGRLVYVRYLLQKPS